jgi:hypothetical protein
MAADPRSMRASDEDRDRAASLLREHHAVGRLTPEEFSERLDKVFQARTIGDLDDLLDDLPGIDLYRLPDASVRRGRGPIPGGSSHFSALQAQGGFPAIRLRNGAWGSWFSLSLLCFVIWAVVGGGYLWPLWVAASLGALVLGKSIAGGRRHGGSSHDQRHHEHGRDHHGRDHHGRDHRGRDYQGRDHQGRGRGPNGDHDQIGDNAPDP